MPGAVPVIQAGVPHQGTRHRIQRRAVGAFRKFLSRQLDVTAQDKGVQSALTVRARADNDRARVVRRSPHDLRPGVHQEQVAVGKQNVVAGLAVVHNRPVRPSRGNGGEAQVAEPFFAGILFVQHFRVRPFAHTLARVKKLLKPGQTANLRRRGVHMRPPHAGDLGVVLLRFHRHHGVAAFMNVWHG